MHICCTKKLLDEMGIITENRLEENDLFCWSAHLITVNRRKTVVVVNDSNRFGFILYGLKAKDLKRLNELIIEGVRASLLNEKIKNEIIEQYLQTASELVFTKTRGPKYVARLNKACERVQIYDDLLNSSEIIQINAGRNMNNDLVNIINIKDYEYPHIVLKKDLEELTGEQIISCEALDLIIKLDLGRYIAWRRIITPSDINFKQLHEILQVAFDWKGHHLHEFEVYNQAESCILNVVSEHEEIYEPREDCKILLDAETTLSDYARKGLKIVYRYDYGDN